MCAKSIVLLVVFSTTLGVANCKSKQTDLDKLGVSEEEARDILNEIAEKKRQQERERHLPAPGPQTTEVQRTPETSAAPAAPPAEEQDTDPTLKSDRFIVDGLVDVAEAGQSSAHSHGVFMVTRDRQLLHAKLGTLSGGTEPAPSPIAELPRDSGPFELARGPTFSDTHAYWVSERFVLRHPLPHAGLSSTAETVVTDARVATRTSAVTVEEKGRKHDLLAYIALPTEKGDPLRAKLWTGDDHNLVLTPEGAAALSVQLSRTEDGLRAYSLEGRTGMSALHARGIDVKDGKVELGEDQVVWVGGGSTSTTELRLTPGQGDDVFGLLPIEQDVSHFGMAILQLSQASGDDPAPNKWAPYPNGMEWSPTDGDKMCGSSAVLFARPSSPAPKAPQELVLGELAGGEVTHELVLSRSKKFFDASIAALPGGALVSYVADRRTWARTIRCASAEKKGAVPPPAATAAPALPPVTPGQ